MSVVEGKPVGVALERHGPTGIGHLELGKAEFGSIQAGEQRFDLAVDGPNVMVHQSGAGPAPTIGDLPAIGQALRAAGYEKGIAIIGPGHVVPIRWPCSSFRPSGVVL